MDTSPTTNCSQAKFSMKKPWKHVLRNVAATVAMFLVAIALLVGPWPVYRSRTITLKTLAEAGAKLTESPHVTPLAASEFRTLRAGWASRSVTPQEPVPLFGYGARKGRLSTGVAQDIKVRALALDNGAKTVVIISADLLLIPNNISAPVRKRLGDALGLPPGAILFSATHTHSAPNPWDNTFAGRLSGGSYVKSFGHALVNATVDAALDAVDGLMAAEIGRGGINAPQFVRNRARPHPVDARLEYLLVRRKDATMCCLLNFSAHATVLGDENLLIGGDYPGYLQDYLQQAGIMGIFQAGAVGSCSPVPPQPGEQHTSARVREQAPPDQINSHARAAALGEALANQVLSNMENVTYANMTPISFLRTEVPLPPFQVRLSPNWRLSPFLLPLLGVKQHASIQVLRIHDMVIVGLPVELSAELAVPLKQSAANHDISLWIASFAADYRGYVSPDEHYWRTRRDGSLPYETGLMSWCGPDAGHYFGTLTRWLIQLTAPETALPDDPTPIPPIDNPYGDKAPDEPSESPGATKSDAGATTN